MIQKVKCILSLTALLFSVCCLVGCATADFGWGNRFYTGNPLPKNEIALVFAINDCFIYDIRNETEKEEKIFGLKLVGWGPWDMLDLVPGRYFAGIIYSRGTAGTTYTMGGRVQTQINVQAGNIYVIYPEVTDETESNKHKDSYGRQINTTRNTKEAARKWRPIIVNFNDYSKEECQMRFGPLDSCYEKDKIMELAAKYLHSERLIMTFRPFKEPIQKMWEVDGVRGMYNGVWR
jgi:hypothetical protein